MISLATPLLLLLAPLPWFVQWLVPMSTISQHPLALRVPFYQRLKSFSPSTGSNFNYRPNWRWIAYLIWLLLVVAISGPQQMGRPINLPRTGHNVLLVIDLSQSMSLPDFTLGNRHADRLDVVKKVAGQFIMGRKGDRVGLILFGSKAYLRTPLTFDLNTVVATLNDATVGLAGRTTSIGDAIGLGIKRLETYPPESRVMILLTDGASNTGVVTPAQAADIAAKEKIKIYTIGIGADRMIVAGMFGPEIVNPSNDLDEDTLKKIAKITGGEFFRAKDTKTLQEVYSAIDKLEPITDDTAMLRPITPLYQWPLGLAIILSFCWGLHKITQHKSYKFLSHRSKHGSVIC